MESRRARGSGLLALGGALAVEGPLAKLSLGLGALIVCGGILAVLALARGDRPERLASVPLVASSALAWGAGTMLAFAASAHAFRRDKQRGIRALIAARAGSDAEYLWARVSGLLRVLGIVTAGGTVVLGLAATLAAREAPLAVRTLEATAAGAAFSIAFAATLASVGLATLGARSRVGGYFALVGVLVLPELLQGMMTRVLPDGWGELASIPGALLALRGALAPETFDPLRFSRAFALLALIFATALLVVRGQLRSFDRDPA
jgi:hypothetical protein